VSDKKEKELELMERERQVVELRRTGATWEGIAQAVGYSNAGGAYKAYQRAMARVFDQPTKELRNAELDRLDRLQRAFWKDAVDGNVRSADFILRVIDKRAKLLGLDAPTKIQAEVVNYDAGVIDAEIERIIRELNELDQGITVEVEEGVSTEGTTTA
jgi:hypothetical protein